MDIVKIENLTRDYGKNRGVFDLNFSIVQGEVFGFLGPNGAGKTTTLRHLMGFLQPRLGKCTVNGMDCWLKSTEIQKNLGYIPGEMAFPEDMTGREFLQFYAKYRGMKDPSRKNKLLERFELDARGKMKKMSKGMKQKIGIVAAFMHDPAVLILDEPTSGLDPLMQNYFIELILEEKERGKTILMSSHMFEEVERCCHRVGIIKDGRMAALDSVEALKASKTKKYIVTFEHEADAARFAKEPLQIGGVYGAQVTVLVQNNIKELIEVMNRYPVVNISTPNQNLEEIFLHYYGGVKA